MNFINDIEFIELEISSDCNAACPACCRNSSISKYDVKNLTLSDIKNIFPDGRYFNGKKFSLCGTLGDPLLNPEILEIVKHILNNNAKCTISSNVGYQTKALWSELGQLSKSTNRLEVMFAVDGMEDTNHIYRINTNFNVIKRNMEAYCSAGGKASWPYIVFDHNEKDVERARQYATKLGVRFGLRTGMRNSLNVINAVSRVKDKETNKMIKIDNVIASTNPNYDHKDKHKVFKLMETVNNIKNINNDEVEHVVQSIKCKTIHEKQLFLASNMTLWPCCYLWDNYVKDAHDIREKMSINGEGWNDLSIHTLDTILNHSWFRYRLQESWYPDKYQHLNTCIVKCGADAAYKNKINYE